MSRRTPSASERRPKGGFALVGRMGGYVAVCILAGLGIGLLLDHLLHTGPIFLLSGVVVGFVVSFYLMYRLAMGELDE